MSLIRKTSSTGSYAYIDVNDVTGTVTAERDFPGVFPVYYTVTGSECFCGFSIKDVIQKSGISIQSDPEALGLYLTFSCLPGEHTFYKNVRKLMPGCRLEYKDNTLSVTQVSCVNTEKKSDTDIHKITENIRTAIEEAVRKAPADAAFLSSGIDSSVLSKLGNVSDTYTADYGEEKFSEADAAAAFSAEIGASHHRLRIECNDYFASLYECSEHIEQPVGDCSYPVYYMLCKMAKENGQTVFSGEGADEFFFGYPLQNYLMYGWYEKLPRKIRRTMLSAFGWIHPGLKKFLTFHDGDYYDGYRGPVTVFSESEKEKLLQEYHGDAAIRTLLDEMYDGIEDLPLEERMFIFNIREWLEADILTGAVKLAAGAGISVVMPFLDSKVIQTACRIPVKYQLYGGETKHLFREAFKNVLPDGIVRRKKKGFPVPVSCWMRKKNVFEHIRSVLSSHEADRFFKRDKVAYILDNYISAPEDNWTWRKIWLMYSYMIWAQTAGFIDL